MAVLPAFVPYGAQAPLSAYNLIGDVGDVSVSIYVIGDDGLRAASVVTTTISGATPTTFAALLGSALPADAAGVILQLGGAVRVDLVRPGGTVTITAVNKSAYPSIAAGQAIIGGVA
jgi:hypothetical protein